MKVSEIFLSKVLGEDICNLLICREVFKKNGLAMHQLPNVVHVNLNMFGNIPLKWICGYLDSTLVVMKYYCGQRTTNLKL